MSNEERILYRLIPGVDVDVEKGEITQGYFIEKKIYLGSQWSGFFHPGTLNDAIKHIKLTNGAIDKNRLKNLSKFLTEIQEEEEKC